MTKRSMQWIMVWSIAFVLFLRFAPVATASNLVGTRTWNTLLCQFNGDATTPFSVQAVQTQFGSTYPGVSDYWRIQSNSAFTLSTQTFGWYTLPHTQADYENMGTDAGRAALFTDCLQAATRTDTPEIVTAIVTSEDSTLNGQYLDDVIINPSWIPKLERLVSISGHVLGLRSATGITPDTATIWDSLSIPAPFCDQICPIPHITAYAKQQAGWLTAYDSHPAPTTESVYTLSFLDAPAGDYLHLLAVQGDTTLYTLEARRIAEAYVNATPRASALVIHRVTASPEPIQLQAMLESVGASFTLTDAGLTVTVERITDDGFQVRVKPLTTETLTPETPTPETPTPETPTPETPTPETPTPTEPAPTNYVYNGSFELKTAAFLPQSWARTKLTQDIVVCNTPENTPARTGECAFRFRGSTGEASQISQKLLLPSAKRGTILEVSAYTRSQKLLRGALIQVQIYYVDPVLRPESLVTWSGTGFGQYRYNAASIELAGEVAYAVIKIGYKEPKGMLLIDDVTVVLH